MTTFQQAQEIVNKFKMDTKESDYTVIEGDDAAQLVLDIDAALAQRERETWLGVVEDLTQARLPNVWKFPLIVRYRAKANEVQP